jgi:nucleoside-diphosphate-sugar epimerase
MRALVIGGTGFIGTWVVRQLAEAGHAVSVLHRGRVAPNSLPPGVTSVVGTGELSSVAALQIALDGPAPDVIIHVLAMRAAEAEAAVAAFRGRTGRMVVLSSGDVYRAYGRFMRIEPGPPEKMPLTADRSELRTRLYPYRSDTTKPGTLQHDYDKIEVERIFRNAYDLPTTVLRLPKVYGAAQNSDFVSVHRFAHHQNWRWTHGYVENVAAAIVLAATHPAAAGRVYNVGESTTPTVQERLAGLPPSDIAPDFECAHDFAQDMVYDTNQIRTELGYAEPVEYEEGIGRTVRPAPSAHATRDPPPN